MIDLGLRRFVALLFILGSVAGVVFAGSEVEQSDAAAAEAVDADEVSRILALSDDIAYGEYLAGECASCHMTAAVEGSAVPVIHGSEPVQLVRAVLEYRAGIRSNSTMALVANGLGDEELAAIAHYMASQ